MSATRPAVRTGPVRRMLPFALVLCVASPVQAHFEHALLSTRTASLGGAFVAIADDPSAIVDNPAGLSGLSTFSLLATYQRPYGVEGLDDGYLAAAAPAAGLGLGVSWFHRGLDGALSEDLLTVSIARDLKRTSEDASLSVGVNVDFARVAARGDFDDSATTLSFGAGVLLRPFAFIGLGYNVRNVNQPSFDLVEGGGATALSTAQAAGLAWYWQDRLVATVEAHQDATGAWRSRGGLELRAAAHVTLRGGLESANAAVGIGIEWRGIGFDAGMTGHEELGASYLVSLRYSPPVSSRYGTLR